MAVPDGLAWLLIPQYPERISAYRAARPGRAGERLTGQDLARLFFLRNDCVKGLATLEEKMAGVSCRIESRNKGESCQYSQRIGWGPGWARMGYPAWPTSGARRFDVGSGTHTVRSRPLAAAGATWSTAARLAMFRCLQHHGCDRRRCGTGLFRRERRAFGQAAREGHESTGRRSVANAADLAAASTTRREFLCSSGVGKRQMRQGRQLSCRLGPRGGVRRRARHSSKPSAPTACLCARANWPGSAKIAHKRLSGRVTRTGRNYGAGRKKPVSRRACP